MHIVRDFIVDGTPFVLDPKKYVEDEVTALERTKKEVEEIYQKQPEVRPKN